MQSVPPRMFLVIFLLSLAPIVRAVEPVDLDMITRIRYEATHHSQVMQTLTHLTQNIGARRLQTVMERLLDEVSFAGPELSGQRVVIDAGYVRQRLDEIAQDTDLSRFIL